MAPTRGYRVFQAVNAVVLTGVVVVTLYPFVNILARSFSGEHFIRAGQVNLVPRGFNLETYRIVLADRVFWTDYRNTVVYTVVATAVSMLLTTCFAYVLAKKSLKGRPVLVAIAVFTMFFNGGLIPNYVLVSELGLRNTIWAIVLPNAIDVFNLLVMKAFFESLPVELEEAAAVDGLDTYRILLRIVLPLSKAVTAVVALFYAVGYWNAFFNAMLYINTNSKWPLQLVLRTYVLQGTAFPGNGLANQAGSGHVASLAVQMAVVVLSLVPVLLIYPFVQKHFTKGVLIGAVKG
jgi:putative aldouronate transport system permease protein